MRETALVGVGAPSRPRVAHRRRYALALALLFLTYGLAVLAGIGLWVAAVAAFAASAVIAAAFLAYLGTALLAALLPSGGDDAEEEPEWVCPVERPDVTALVGEVAAAMGTSPPGVRIAVGTEAHLRHDGGFLGLGGRTTLVLGMPLLVLLDLEELRAVVAHELGHQVGRDARLGWTIFATGRTLHRMHEEVGRRKWIAWVAVPIDFACRRFHRTTMGWRREAELAADQWGAAVAGGEAAASALRRHLALEPGLGAFSVLLGSLGDTGVLPENIADALREFDGSVTWREAVADADADDEPHDFDTHPPKSTRLGRFDSAVSGGARADLGGRLAPHLASELAWSDEVLRQSDLAGVDRQPWPIARQRLLNRLRAFARYAQCLLPDLTWGSMASLVAEQDTRLATACRLERRLRGYQLPDRDQRVGQILANSLTSWLGMMLYEDGWFAEVHAGDPTVFTRGDDRIVPYELLSEVFGAPPPAAGAPDPLAAVPLDPGARVNMPDDGRDSIAAGFVSPFVALGSAEAVGVRGPAEGLCTPFCCPVCLGTPTAFHEVVAQPVVGREWSWWIGSCAEHEPLARTAVWARYEGNGIAALATNRLPWGTLLLACNGIDSLPLLVSDGSSFEVVADGRDLRAPQAP